MGKELKNPIEIRLTVLFDDGLPVYHIENVNIRYTVACPLGLQERRIMYLGHNQEVLNIVKDFIEEGMRQIDIKEGIPEEDSMMDYNGAPSNLTSLAQEPT